MGASGIRLTVNDGRTVAEEFSKVKLTGNVSERRNRYESVLHNLMGFTLVCANH